MNLTFALEIIITCFYKTSRYLLYAGAASFLMSSCLGTKYLQGNQKLLYRQTIEAPKKFNKAGLNDLPLQKPNSKFLWLPINALVWMYHTGEKKFVKQKPIFITKKVKVDEKFNQKISKTTNQKKINNLQYRKKRKNDALDKKIENGNLFMQWGEPLAVYDSTMLAATIIKMNNYLFIKGYFQGKTSASVTKSRQKVIVNYKVNPGVPYLIDTIVYSVADPQVLKIIKASKSLIAKGDQYDQDKIGKERERTDFLLKDHGYYNFTRQYIDYQLDTSSRKKHAITLLVEVRNPSKLDHHRQFKIDSVSMTTDVGVKNIANVKRISEPYEKITFNYYNPEYSKKILAQRLFIIKDSLYSRSKTISTQRQLANLDVFKFVNINYDTSRGRFTANIFASPLDRYSWSNEAGVTVTQGFPGPYVSTNIKRRNLFGGMEILDLNGRFGYEGVASATETRNIYTSTEASANVSVTFPQFLFPFSRAASFQYARNNPRTKLLAGYTYTNRPEYQRGITTVSASYTWDINQKVQFSLTPTSLSIIRSTVDSSYRVILNELKKQGNNLENAFKPSFVGSMIFSATWNNNYGSTQKNSTLLRGTIESGGTLLNLYTPQFIINQGLETYQYIRLSVDLRKNININKNAAFAWRINSGFGYAYSANGVMPYEKNFFAGGSNSVRAWRPRRLGVGSVPPLLSTNPSADGYFNYQYEKPGDLLIEGSMEWRQKLVGPINYALFIDAGNVWALKSTSNEAAQFNLDRFYKEIAVGTGFGLRLDFSFLILRLDVGIKAWDPARPEGERFILNRFAFSGPYGIDKEPVIYNVGIGYPF